MSQKVAFVFVPGAWHGPKTWDSVASRIEIKDYACVAVELPSTTGDNSAGYGDDVEAVREAIQGQTSQGRDVVLVVHSYGGHVGSSAIKGFNGAPSSNTPPGHVIGIAMIATGFNVTGVSFLSGFDGKPPPHWTVDKESGFVNIVVDPVDMFYHDLSAEEGKHWVSRLTKQSLKSLAEGGEYAYAGWKDVPCWFLATAQDHALPVEAQRFFVKTAQDTGADVTMREVASSHSPMLSQPDTTADFVLEAATYFLTK